jgi:hypothetical protein
MGLLPQNEVSSSIRCGEGERDVAADTADTAESAREPTESAEAAEDTPDAAEPTEERRLVRPLTGKLHAESLRSFSLCASSSYLNTGCMLPRPRSLRRCSRSRRRSRSCASS